MDSLLANFFLHLSCRFAVIPLTWILKLWRQLCGMLSVKCQSLIGSHLVYSSNIGILFLGCFGMQQSLFANGCVYYVNDIWFCLIAQTSYSALHNKHNNFHSTGFRTFNWIVCVRVYFFIFISQTWFIRPMISVSPTELNSLRPSDAIWWRRSGSTLSQVMACCLMAPCHYPNQCWLIMSKVWWHSSDCNFSKDTSATNHLN